MGTDPFGPSDLNTVHVVPMAVMRILMVVVGRVVVAEDVPLPDLEALLLELPG